MAMRPSVVKPPLGLGTHTYQGKAYPNPIPGEAERDQAKFDHERIADLGGVPMPMTPADFGQFVAEETEKWGKVVKFAGAKAG
jgi:hypothetical protein